MARASQLEASLEAAERKAMAALREVDDLKRAKVFQWSTPSYLARPYVEQLCAPSTRCPQEKSDEYKTTYSKQSDKLQVRGAARRSKCCGSNSSACCAAADEAGSTVFMGVLKHAGCSLREAEGG